ncbi:uncharacterized protein LOC110436915 isoform X2 [Sorghum bicolor]|uniref:uncharacterized protein LOC110436915 isoform X2 n=1 Tax=Sorghum bicolor TaxID=4558 RepID=UPI00081AC1E7|nr:uncharacterized protein LOC110436915 isoform X2 [Sorghum bicolor]|eukprot:XP_021320299.1 uncharacterized protein LOC110436915 isoform X2 [Sorghum bicolor]
MESEIRHPFPSLCFFSGHHPFCLLSALRDSSTAAAAAAAALLCRRHCHRPPRPPPPPRHFPSPNLDFRTHVPLISSKPYLPARCGSSGAACGGSGLCPHRGCHGQHGEPPWIWATSRCPPLFAPSPQIGFLYRRRGRARCQALVVTRFLLHLYRQGPLSIFGKLGRLAKPCILSLTVLICEYAVCGEMVIHPCSDMHTSDHADLQWTYIIGLGAVDLH